jgi:hypothetical protein
LLNGPQSRRDSTREDCVREIRGMINDSHPFTWDIPYNIFEKIFKGNPSPEVEALVLPLLGDALHVRWPNHFRDKEASNSGTKFLAEFAYNLAVERPHLRKWAHPHLARWNLGGVTPSYYLALVELNEAMHKIGMGGQQERMEAVQDFYTQRMRPVIEKHPFFEADEADGDHFPYTFTMGDMFGKRYRPFITNTRPPKTDILVQECLLEMWLMRVTAPVSDFSEEILSEAAQTMEGRSKIAGQAWGLQSALQDIEKHINDEPQLRKVFDDYFTTHNVMTLVMLKDVIDANRVDEKGQSALHLPEPERRELSRGTAQARVPAA